MVFRGAPPPDASYGAPSAGLLVYVMRGTVAPWIDTGCCEFTLQAHDFHGTAVIEGNGGSGCNATSRDLVHRSGARIWTEPNVYGYPLAYLVFDPVEAVADAPEPTASPLDPQETCADVGGAPATEVHGIVYSGGSVEFSEVVVDGGIVAFQLQTQAGPATYGYNPTYGQAAPPPGFPAAVGRAVVLVRKSLALCVNYAADSSGGSPCQ
jgi:hypothetical protein